MKLITENLQSELNGAFKRHIKHAEKVLVCSPFLSPFGVDLMASWIERNPKLNLTFVTNTSDLNLLISFRNPIKNLLELRKDFPKNITILSHGSLHAKAYIIPGKIALGGSSNLTQSGMTQNKEINFKITNSKKDAESFEEILHWFDELARFSRKVTDKELRELFEKWKDYQKQIPKRFITEGASLHLGVDSWNKVKELSRYKRVNRKQLLGVISDQEKLSEGYFNRKIRFLENLGVINGSIEGSWVVVKDQIQRYDKKKETLVEDLYSRVQGVREVLRFLKEKGRKRVTHKDLEEMKALPKSHLQASLNWLHSLGYIRKTRYTGKGQTLFYALTPSGRSFLPKLRKTYLD